MHKKKQKLNTKNIILALGLLFIIIDVLCKIIFIGYNMNLLYIAVIIFALANMEKHKKWFTAILVLAIIFMGVNLTNKTYLKVNGIKLEIPAFTYKTKLGYKSLLPLKGVGKKIERILENYETLGCGFNYYYDIKKDVTILNYNVSKSQLITIETEKGNACTKLKTTKYDDFKEIEDLEKESFDELVKKGYYVYKDGIGYNKDEFTKFINSEDERFIRMITFTSNDTYTILDLKYYNDSYELRYSNKFNNDEEIILLTRHFDYINFDGNEINIEYNGDTLICAKHN